MTTLPSAAAPVQDVPRLLCRTVRFAGDLPDLTRLLPPDESPLCWVRRGEGIVGWGAAASLRVAGSDRFRVADEWFRQVVGAARVRDDVQVAGSGLVAFGTFSFADSEPTDLGVSVLTIPRVVVGRAGRHCFVTSVSASPELPPMPTWAESPPAAPAGLRMAEGSVSGTEWMGRVASAVARITAGELGKVVLSRDLVARADGPIDLRHPLSRLAQEYRDCWTFCVDGLVGATPELLARRERGLVTSRVLAGTIRRTGDDDRDLALAASLARSSKDLEEHEFAVASVADTLADSCSGMNVPDTPYVLHLPNVMHLATEVTGVLDGPEDAMPSSLALAGALHPTAAICGTPTATAAALIAELEAVPRGRYSGPVGWIGADGDGEWGIALRCAQQLPGHPETLRLHVGCGIVAGSDPRAELAESSVKAKPIISALQPG